MFEEAHPAQGRREGTRMNANDDRVGCSSRPNGARTLYAMPPQGFATLHPGLFSARPFGTKTPNMRTGPLVRTSIANKSCFCDCPAAVPGVKTPMVFAGMIGTRAIHTRPSHTRPSHWMGVPLVPCSKACRILLQSPPDCGDEVDSGAFARYPPSPYVEGLSDLFSVTYISPPPPVTR